MNIDLHCALQRKVTFLYIAPYCFPINHSFKFSICLSEANESPCYSRDSSKIRGSLLHIAVGVDYQLSGQALEPNRYTLTCYYKIRLI